MRRRNSYTHRLRSLTLWTGTVLFTGLLFAAIVVADVKGLIIAFFLMLAWALIWMED